MPDLATVLVDAKRVIAGRTISEVNKRNESVATIHDSSF